MTRCVVLTGYMGAGKSTVGKALAARLGWRFVDTDVLVTEMAGRTPAELMGEGESHFRLWERQAIATLVGQQELVVATGGGAVTDDDSRAFLAAMGSIVLLDAPLEVLWERVGGDAERPFARDRELFAARHAVRRLMYDRFPLAYDTRDGRPEDVAAEIAGDLTAPTARVPVALGDRAYEVTVAPGLLSDLAAFMPRGPGPCLVVSDDGVPAWHVEVALASLRFGGWLPWLEQVPAGEGSKSLASAQRLYDACARAGLGRQSPVVALGGGVVGDLAGFVAATFMRGVPLVQVPTTLLAQVDAAVGGKVALNHPAAKNLIGAFHQPFAVVADPVTLLTLPERDYRSGLAEVVKYGLLGAPDLFEALEAQASLLARRPLPFLTQLVARCCGLKARIVTEDEREAPGGPRSWLNLGHTVGHALEAVAGFERLTHGEAVAIGMVLEAEVGVRMGLTERTVPERLRTLLRALGLPTEPPALDHEALVDAMRLDKKNRGSGPTAALPARLGEVTVQPMDEAALRQVLRGVC
jgi:3-dehydroquinate synthase